MKVVNPPKDETQLAETGKWLYAGLAALGIKMNPEGFVLAWTGGASKVIVETDSDNKITSAALLAVGQKWTNSEQSATLLEMAGDRKRILDYCLDLANAFGATHLYYDSENDSEPGELTGVRCVTL